MDEQQADVVSNFAMPMDNPMEGSAFEPIAPMDRQNLVLWLLRRIDHINSAAEQNWRYLQAAHIAGQTQFALHGAVHLRMLRQSWHDGDLREALGQLLRLALVPLGHLTGRLPLGNSGRSDVSAFMPMVVRPEIAEVLVKVQRDALRS